MQNGNIKKKLMCRPYPVVFVVLFRFFYLIANIMRARCTEHWIADGGIWKKKQAESKKRERECRARTKHRKMSQEIKTPSIVNLHNKLCARFPLYRTISMLCLANSDKDQYLTVDSLKAREYENEWRQEKKPTLSRCRHYSTVIIITYRPNGGNQ